MRPNCYIAGDYAGIEGPIEAYYGYEVVDEDTEEWCFVVRKKGKEVFRRTNSQLLEIAPNNSPEGMLIAGLALYLNK